MQWITVATSSLDIDQFDTVDAELGEEPEGLEARYVGPAADGKLRIVGLWASKDHADRFYADQLGPARTRALGPDAPAPTEQYGIEVNRTYVAETVN